MDTGERPNMRKWVHVCYYSHPLYLHQLTCSHSTHSHMQCFNDFDGVIFCVDVSAYPFSSFFPFSVSSLTFSVILFISSELLFYFDLDRYDNCKQDGGLHHSLRLLKELRDSHYFHAMDIILFLNKTDIFREKITRVPLTVCFPEYTGMILVYFSSHLDTFYRLAPPSSPSRHSHILTLSLLLPLSRALLLT